MDTFYAILRPSRKTFKIDMADFLYFRLLHFPDGF